MNISFMAKEQLKGYTADEEVRGAGPINPFSLSFTDELREAGQIDRRTLPQVIGIEIASPTILHSDLVDSSVL